MRKSRGVLYFLGALVLWYILLFPIFLYIHNEKKVHFEIALRSDTLTHLKPLSIYIDARLQQYELLMEMLYTFHDFEAFLDIFRNDVIRLQETKNILLLNQKLEIQKSLYPAGSLEKAVLDTVRQDPAYFGSSYQCSLFAFASEVHLILSRSNSLPEKTDAKGVVLILSPLQLLPEHLLFTHPLKWIALVAPNSAYILLHESPSPSSDPTRIEKAIKTSTDSNQGPGIERIENTLIGWDSLRIFPLKVLMVADLEEGIAQIKEFTTLLFAGGYLGATLLFLLVGLLVRYKLRTQSQARELRIKETILRETHHRIKNNIQTISSLLDLQREEIDNPELQKSLTEAISRLRVIAQLHEELYRQDSLEAVNLKEYCGGLLATLAELYDLSRKQIALHADIEENLHLDLKRAQSCGFIIHELITNAVKHAFPQGNGGVIRVGIQKKEDTIHLSVEDTGVGIKQEGEESSGLGMAILQSMVQQLNGSLTQDGFQGMKVRVEFPYLP